MAKKIIAFVLMVMMLMTTFVSADVAASDVIKLYVSLDGSDSNEGTSESAPFYSIERARAESYLIRKGGDMTPIDIIIEGGEYRFEDAVTMGPSDNNGGGQIRFIAKDGDEVIIKGSKKLDISKAKRVTDADVLRRIPVEGRENVIVFDLAEQGLKASEITTIPNGFDENNYTVKTRLEGSMLYLNNERQTLARWPNGHNEYAQFTGVIDTDDPKDKPNDNKSGVQGMCWTYRGGIITISQDRIKNWTEAVTTIDRSKDNSSYPLDTNNPSIVGWTGVDYFYERVHIRSIDPSAKTIELRWGTRGGVSKGKSKRWAIVNLIEELDFPGEYYIDHTDPSRKLLYYYPTDGFNENSTLEITTHNRELFNVDGTDNIAFDGLTFSQTKDCAIRLRGKTKNITISNCIFENIDQYGIYGTSSGSTEFAGYTSPSVDDDNNIISLTNAKFSTNGAESLLIENNAFYNIGYRGLVVNCGDRDKNISSNSKILNNYFYNMGVLRKQDGVMTVGGADVEISNNTADYTGYGITLAGAEMDLHHNEIYNAMGQVDDGSAIYKGAGFINRGTKIHHNYIHQVLPTSKEILARKEHYHHGIYLDDKESGAEVYNNIIKDVDWAGIIINAGMSNHMYNNTIINAPYGSVNLYTYDQGVKHAKIRQKTAAESVLEIGEDGLAIGPKTVTNKAGETFTLAYNYQSLIDDYNFAVTNKDGNAEEEYNNKFAHLARNVVTKNASLGKQPVIASNAKYPEDNTVTDNYEVTADDFADYAGNNFLLKPTSQAAIQNPDLNTTANTKMSDFGIDVDKFAFNPIVCSDINLVYPKNNSVLNTTTDVSFTWERPRNADKFTLTLATNEAFTENVKTYETYETTYVATGLSKGKTYYWKVSTEHSSLVEYRQWSSDVSSFSIASKFAQDNMSLEEAITLATTTMNSITDDTKHGVYIAGTKAVLQKALDKANEMKAWWDGLGFLSQLSSTNKAKLYPAIQNIDSIVNSTAFKNTVVAEIEEMIASLPETSKINLSNYVEVEKELKAIEDKIATLAEGTTISKSSQTRYEDIKVYIDSLLDASVPEIEEEIENLPSADVLTNLTYGNYINTMLVLDKKVELVKTSLSADALEKYEVFKSKYDEIKNKYVVFDMTKVANGQMFAGDGAPTVDSTGWVQPQFLSIQGWVEGSKEKAYTVFDNKAFDSLKNDEGNILADNGTPFYFRTEKDAKNTINLGGMWNYPGRLSSATVDVDNDVFKEISVVLYSTAADGEYTNTNTWFNDYSFRMKIYYEDGTYTEDPNWRGRFAPAGPYTTARKNNFLGHLAGEATTGSTFAAEPITSSAGGYFLSRKVETSFSQFETTPNMGYVNDGTRENYKNGMLLPVYSLPANASKKVDKIVFSFVGKDWDEMRAMISILAVTGIKADDNYIAQQSINKYVEMIPDAELVTAGNYRNYLELNVVIDNAIALGGELPDEYLDKYEAFVDRMDVFRSKYKTINLQGNGATAQIFNTTGVYHKDTTSSYPMTLLDGFTYQNYLSNGDADTQHGSYQQGMGILNANAIIANKNADGNIYAANGIPFDIRADLGKKNGILIGGSNGQKNTVNINAEAGYSKFAIATVGKGNATYVTGKITVKYKGEDAISYPDVKFIRHFQTARKLPGYNLDGITSDSQIITGKIVGISSIDCFNGSDNNHRLSFQDMFASGYAAKNSTTPYKQAYYPGVYEFELDPKKEVEYITITGVSGHGTIGVIGMTLVKEETVTTGDITGDGAITTADHIMLGRYFAKWKDYTASVVLTKNADLNADSVVNTKDRTVLARYLAKWEGYETLPYVKQ